MMFKNPMQGFGVSFQDLFEAYFDFFKPKAFENVLLGQNILAGVGQI